MRQEESPTRRGETPAGAPPGAAPAPPRFPVRVAAVDVGSNAIRLLAAEFSDATRWTPLASERAAVRLGQGVFATGTLEPHAMDAAVDALAGFRLRIDALGIHRYRAVATSAVRDSRNGGDLVRRVRERCGLELEPISGTEEARLVWTAVASRVPLGEGVWLLADLGGGSLEISIADAEGLRRSGSYPLGAVRLLGRVEADPEREPERFRRELERHPDLSILDEAASGVERAGLIATGGNAEALADLGGATPDLRGVRTLATGRLMELTDTLGRLTPRERMIRFDIKPDRADVILPAAVLYLRAAAAIGADRIVVPDVGVKEGLLLELAAAARHPSDP